MFITQKAVVVSSLALVEGAFASESLARLLALLSLQFAVGRQRAPILNHHTLKEGNSYCEMQFLFRFAGFDADLKFLKLYRGVFHSELDSSFLLRR